MNQVKKYLPWVARIVIFGLFMLSGVAKMFPLSDTHPLWMFDKQLVDLGITSWCFAPFLSRLIIALEIAIAIAILFDHHIKRIVIPVTIALLIAFNIHLTIQMVEFGPMNGNCGCFGALLPMTPLEAFIKNLLTIGILIYLYKVLKNKPKGENRFSYLLATYLGSALFMFMAFAHDIKPCLEKKNPVQSEISENSSNPNSLGDGENTNETDSLAAGQVETEDESTTDAEETNDTEEDKDNSTTDLTKKADESKTTETAIEKGPVQRTSRFAPYTNFNGKAVNLDQGKQIVCLFAAGCDHCQETAKELTELNNKGILPPLHIIFMDEETFKIPEFFKKAGKTYPYTIVDIPKFWQLLGDGSFTPGVIYMWNGNIQKYYQGTEAGKFDKHGLEKVLSK